MKQLNHAMAKAGSVLLLTTFIAAAGLSQTPEASRQMKPIIDKYVEVWNTGNVKDLDAIVDPHFVRHANSEPVVEDIDGLKKVISRFRTAYPDLKIVVNEDIYAENKSVGRWALTGTNTGAGEMPPTGKAVKQWGISILHFANGKITEEYAGFDNLALMQTLGYTLAPPSEKEKK
jgi:predicted ester cyclase